MHHDPRPRSPPPSLERLLGVRLRHHETQADPPALAVRRSARQNSGGEFPSSASGRWTTTGAAAGAERFEETSARDERGDERDSFERRRRYAFRDENAEASCRSRERHARFVCAAADAQSPCASLEVCVRADAPGRKNRDGARRPPCSWTCTQRGKRLAAGAGAVDANTGKRLNRPTSVPPTKNHPFGPRRRRCRGRAVRGRARGSRRTRRARPPTRVSARVRQRPRRVHRPRGRCAGRLRTCPFFASDGNSLRRAERGVEMYKPPKLDEAADAAAPAKSKRGKTRARNP